MKKVLFILVIQFALATTLYAQSELSGRYGIGLGWSYLNISGIMLLKLADDDIVMENGSIIDIPKIIVNKFGITERLAIEPTIAIIYYHDKITGTDRNNDSVVNSEDERNRNVVLTSLTPIISYALLQKEKVNFYLKGGISFTYLDLGLTYYKKGIKEPEEEEHSDGIAFSIPLGIGIEWWVLDELSFDITTSMNLFGLYSKKYKNDYTTMIYDPKTGDTTKVRKTERKDDSGIFATFGNYSASFNLVFWY